MPDRGWPEDLKGVYTYPHASGQKATLCDFQLCLFVADRIESWTDLNSPSYMPGCFLLFERWNVAPAPLTLTSFSFCYLHVASLGFCSRSVPLSSSPWKRKLVPFSRVCYVLPLLWPHLYWHLAAHLFAVGDFPAPIIPLIVLCLTLFRLSGLSLCSMHPCSVPDAEAHGKDGNNRPQQLCVSNGEAV